MKGQASNEVRSAASHVAMNEAKGKPRSEGYPVSGRTEEFKGGFQPVADWVKAQGFKTDWEVGINKRGRRAL